MYINQIDNLFDKILDNFYSYLLNENIFNKINTDINFVSFNNLIINTIKLFILNEKLLDILNNNNYKDTIINIIKRYCAFYIYLGIAYYYKGNKDLFITNILEISKNQKDSTFQIANFYNSENNSKIFVFYINIKDILILSEYKSIDKIKILLQNNPEKYRETILLFDDLGEDYFIDNFFIKDNFHNIIKTLIFRQIYAKEEKNDVNNILKETEKIKGEFKYIEIIVSNDKKIVDFLVIEKFLTITQKKKNLAEDIYNYLVEMQEEKEFILKENDDFINFLFSNKILIPVAEDFLRFHKNTDKYDNDSKNRDDTKVRYLLNKINNTKNYYSALVENNIKLKLEIKEYFYKNIEERMAILFNNDEELKIIQKLNFSDNPVYQDYLIDVEDIRKYAYINFKYPSKDSIKLRTNNTIEAFRYCNFKNKKKTSNLEIRVGHNNLDLSVVGVIWNPTRLNLFNNKITKPLDCYKIANLVDVNKKLHTENGYTAFTKIMKNTIKYNSDKNLYCWLFNNKTDKPVNTTEYIDYSINDPTKNIKILLYEIYNLYTIFIQTKLENYVNKIKNFNFWYLDSLFKYYEINYFDFNLKPSIKNNILFKILTNNIKEIKVVEDDTDNIIPGIRKSVIKLPYANIIKDEKNIIIVKKKTTKYIETQLNNKNLPICNHYTKWSSIKNNKTDEFNQLVFDFVKKYVKQNDKGDFICKSCNEMLQLKKYVYEGTYNKDTDTFMTTSLAINQKLEELPKYKNLTRAINNLNKTIEKIGYLADLSYYLGNTPTTKLHRKSLIKELIDLIQIHSEYLKTQPKNRTDLMTEKYNINNLTTLFFFELKDDIFLISSIDTDYYKTIKYNNIIAYLIFLLITELNAGQILNFKDDKRCNYFLFSKVIDQIFNGIYIRINQKEKKLLTKIPLLCYILFYLSCVVSNNKLWYSKNIDNNILIQKTIIHTVIDLINTITEANMSENKNYLYELISTRFSVKLNNIFNDTNLLSRIEKKNNKNIIFNETTKQITLKKNTAIYLNLNNNIEYYKNNISEYCDIKKGTIYKTRQIKNISSLNYLTNCDDGKFHVWQLINDNIICSNCNKNYSELQKNKEKHHNESYYFDKIKFTQLLNLTKKYCLSGGMHQINQNTNICDLCKIDPKIYIYTNDDLKLLYKNLDNIKNTETRKLFNKIKENEENELFKNKHIYKLIKKFTKRYNTDILHKFKSNQYVNYIINFIERLENILGPKVKIDNKYIYLKNTSYIINHDYLGNAIKNNITIFVNDNIFQKKYLESFDKIILYYKDNSNKVYVYYDLVTLQYLGYSEDNKNIKKNKNNVSLIKEYSLLDILLNLGLENEYYNIYHLNNKYSNNTNIDNIDSNNIDSNNTNIDNIDSNNIGSNNIGSNNTNIQQLINILIRTKIFNLKDIINKFESLINSVKNHSNFNNRLYNLTERKIINEFKNKLKNFNIKNSEKHNNVFKHSNIILNNINFSSIDIQLDIKIINNNYIDTSFLHNLYNSDTKLIYFLLLNLNRLLDYNKQSAIEFELAYLIVKIFTNINKQFLMDYTNIEIRKFDYLLNNELPYMDDKIKFVGLYQEIVNIENIDTDLIKEEQDILIEEMNAVDLDDYEIDDDNDESAQVYDAYE